MLIFHRITSEYEEIFNHNAPDSRLTITIDDMQTYFLNLAKTILARLNSHYLAGATIGNNKNNTIIAWFNNQLYHTAPLTLNLVHNAVARAMVGADHSIRVINSPLPFISDPDKASIGGYILVLNIGFAIAMVSAFYIMSYIKVKSSTFYPSHSKAITVVRCC